MRTRQSRKTPSQSDCRRDQIIAKGPSLARPSSRSGADDAGARDQVMKIFLVLAIRPCGQDQPSLCSRRSAGSGGQVKVRSGSEPTEQERELHLDHDTKGVPGSPDLANTIFGKIDASALVIADVTPVGTAPGRTMSDGTVTAARPPDEPQCCN